MLLIYYVYINYIKTEEVFLLVLALTPLVLLVAYQDHPTEEVLALLLTGSLIMMSLCLQ
jgi:hypothetical protein